MVVGAVDCSVWQIERRVRDELGDSESDSDSNGEVLGGCGWCDQHIKDQKCLFHTEPVTYSLLSPPAERRVH